MACGISPLVAFGYLTVDHEGFGSLVLTEASKPVLKGEQNVTMRRYVKPTRTRQSSGRTANGPTRRSAWARANGLAGASARHGVPNGEERWRAGLRDFPRCDLAAEIARNGPDSIEDLRGIPGMGARNSTVSATNCWKSSPPTERSARAGKVAQVVRNIATC